MTESDDQTIACGLRAGSTTAWCALYDRHAPGVWRLVARLMGTSQADVADVVQETFLAAARSARGYDPSRGTLRVWLSGIARRQVALHYRQEQRHARWHEADGSPPATACLDAWLCGDDPEPADVLLHAEVAACVRAALVELPEPYAAALTLRYLEQVPIGEIAAAEGCRAAAIRSRLARARQAFRRAFVRLLPDGETTKTTRPAGG